MKTFAIVHPFGGIVSNVIAGDSLDDVKTVVGDCVEITAETGPAGIGWTWDGTVFLPPQDLPAV